MATISFSFLLAGAAAAAPPARHGMRSSAFPPWEPPHDMDCALRSLALETARHVIGSQRSALSRVVDALRFEVDGCPMPPPSSAAPLPQRPPRRGRGRGETFSTTIRVSASRGSDALGDGSAEKPVATIRHAVATMRKNRRSAQLKLRARIVLEGGDTFHVHRPLELTAQDSRLIIESDPLSSLGPATISGGERLELTMRPLDTAEERAWFGPHAAQHVLKAELDETVLSNFTTLFDATLSADSGSQLRPLEQTRLPWARAPNHVLGVERDLQPSGFAYAAGGGKGFVPWPDARKDVSACESIESPRRNSTIYPVYGRDDDPRESHGWQCFHLGGSASRFGDNRSFWNGTVPGGFRYNASTARVAGAHFFDPTRWSEEGISEGAVVHLFQTGLWGTWQFRLDAVNGTTLGEGNESQWSNQIRFKRDDVRGMGGWQGTFGCFSHRSPTLSFQLSRRFLPPHTPYSLPPFPARARTLTHHINLQRGPRRGDAGSTLLRRGCA